MNQILKGENYHRKAAAQNTLLLPKEWYLQVSLRAAYVPPLYTIADKWRSFFVQCTNAISLQMANTRAIPMTDAGAIPMANSSTIPVANAGAIPMTDTGAIPLTETCTACNKFYFLLVKFSHDFLQFNKDCNETLMFYL
ncbi:hypothetical protein [Pseudomonas sp. R3-41]